MSIHCLICGGPDNWVDGKEIDSEGEELWREIHIKSDHLTEKYARIGKIYQKLFAHRICIKRWLAPLFGIPEDEVKV